MCLLRKEKGKSIVLSGGICLFGSGAEEQPLTFE